jgi:hypothetical protein
MRDLMRLFDILLWIAVIGMLVTEAHGTTQAQQVHTFAVAVAKTEGFYIRGTIPNRLHNPGDICTSLPHAYPGQRGLYRRYAVFKSDQWGWAALEAQIQKVIDGSSTKYTADMTIAQVARVYAENWRYWGTTVARLLHVTPETTVAEFFGLPPRVRAYEQSPVWMRERRDTVQDVLPMLAMPPQVCRESGWLVGALSERTLEETCQRTE